MLIVTDGAVDLPPSLERSPLVCRVSGEVWIGEVPFHGSSEEFWAQLRQGSYPATTPPTVSALSDAYRHPGPVVSLHVSGQLSATVRRAEEAAHRAGSGVFVIDTRSFSVGSGLLVAAVSRPAAGGSPGAASKPASGYVPEAPENSADAPAAALVEFARALPGRLHTFAVVQEVKWLRRSDRSGLLPRAHLDRRHPLVLAVRGRAVVLDQPRHRGGALRRVAEEVLLSASPDLGAWALGHGDALDVDDVVHQLTEAFEQPPAFVSCLDPAVGSHLGPSSLVVAALGGAGQRS